MAREGVPGDQGKGAENQGWTGARARAQGTSGQGCPPQPHPPYHVLEECQSVGGKQLELFFPELSPNFGAVMYPKVLKGLDAALILAILVQYEAVRVIVKKRN